MSTDPGDDPTPPLEMLRRQLDAQQVRLGVHIRKMNSPGSPVYRYGENIWPVALILASSFAATAWIHFWLGAAILAAGCTWWLARVQPRIKDGVFDRTSAWVLQSDLHLDALWAKGVLSLIAELPDGTKIAATRRDEWRSFVRRVAAAHAAAGPAPDAGREAA